MNLNYDSKINTSTKENSSYAKLELFYNELYRCNVQGVNNWDYRKNKSLELLKF